MGIDLGSTKTMIYQQDRGIVVNESSVVAVNMRTDQILAVGGEARKMLGKTPPHIIANKPLEYGIISDFEITEKMIRYFIGRLYAGKLAFSARPRVVVGILDVTEVERWGCHLGRRCQVFWWNILAAAIARIPIRTVGNMIVNLGGGLTEVAVFLGWNC